MRNLTPANGKIIFQKNNQSLNFFLQIPSFLSQSYNKKWSKKLIQNSSLYENRLFTNIVGQSIIQFNWVN